MRRLRFTIVTLVFVALWASPSAAGKMYVGAGIGNSFFSSEYQDALDQIKKIDENSTAWKIFGGFTFPSIIGIEGGYRDFGKVESSVGTDALESKTTGWDISALARLEIAIIDIFGKAGALFWNTESVLGDLVGDDTGTDLIWGLGAGVRLGPLGVRLEWESAEVDIPDNLSMVSLSATFGF